MLVSGRFRTLQWFFGGLATTFPGTATVEGGFSLINWEYDDFYQSLTSFSVEGIIHANQNSKLQSWPSFSPSDRYCDCDVEIPICPIKL